MPCVFGIEGSCLLYNFNRNLMKAALVIQPLKLLLDRTS